MATSTGLSLYFRHPRSERNWMQVRVLTPRLSPLTPFAVLPYGLRIIPVGRFARPNPILGSSWLLRPGTGPAPHGCGAAAPRLPGALVRRLHLQHRDLDAEPGRKLAGLLADRLGLLSGGRR